MNSTVMEWSLVQGEQTGISVFFVDEGIDTGKQVVLSETVNISHYKSLTEAKRYLFNLDPQVYRRAIEKLNAGGVTYQSNDSRRYYVMSKLFQDVAEKSLAIRNPKSEIGNN
jgi:methionyl-tRNA formyltransferase